MNARKSEELLEPEFDSFLSLLEASSLEQIIARIGEACINQAGLGECAIWWLDSNDNGFKLVFDGTESSVIDNNGPFLPYETAIGLGLLDSDDPKETVLTQPLLPFRLSPLSCLSHVIKYEDRISGLILCFVGSADHSWSQQQRKKLQIVSQRASVLCRNFELKTKLTRLVDSLQEMSEKTTDYDLYDLVLQEGKTLFKCDRAVVRRINFDTGRLDYVRSSPKAPKGFALPHGEGVTGKALRESKTFRIADVQSPEWRDIYRPLWPNMAASRSELAVPILLHKSQVRIGTNVKLVNKPFGVLNFESPTQGNFSELDQRCAEVIAQRMALVMERLDLDRKLDRLRRAQQTLALKRDWDSIVDELLKSIQKALGYEFVSLSHVDEDAGVIRCMRVIGLDKPDEFRKAAVHQLDSNNVQADVVRSKKTEVPSPDDPRLSPELAKDFGLGTIIRVFVPMIVPARNEVIGTISAGYDRTYREHIYERDVQHLRGLVAFGTNALELWRRGTIDRVSHEINAPLTAVRGNLSRLRHRRSFMSDEQIDRALEDMETDTEVLYFQVQQLEYVLGGPVTDVIKQPLRTEPVLLFRDIIFKTINQLRPLVRDSGLDPREISFDLDDVYKVSKINVDKGKISQVIFNLFMNAVKYAESPETFQIRIRADELPDHYVIKFCDWGIGIPKGLEQRIFEDRFRAPAAKARNVTGSGLGLTIARQLMREHGGDLILARSSNPTEFHVIIPKHIGVES